MEAVRERLTFEDVTELFDRPGTREEYCRRFAELVLDALPISLCAVVLGPRRAPEVAFAADVNGPNAPADAAVPDENALDALYRGDAVTVPAGDRRPLRGSAVFLPLIGTSGSAGFVTLQGCVHDFDEDDVRKLRSFARVFALALDVAQLSAEVERLAERSTTDALTGVFNRRGFDERIRIEWRRAVRDGSPLAIALLDVDHFRGYNETCGRERGDECLRHIARAIAQAGLRAGDFVARYSGEEFAVVMPGAEEGGALALCDRIRTFVALRSIEHPASPHRIVTISGGVATVVPEPGLSLSAVLYRADTNLYRAKVAGRNRVAGDTAMRSSPLRAAHLQLPTARHPFIGRAYEMGWLAAATGRLITIAGPAGTGKSALALEFARRSLKHAVFVALADCEAEDDVGAYVARALTADPSGDAKLIVVLDSCDHVREGVAAFARDAATTAGMQLVVTGRAPLGVEGELVLALGPLAPEDAVQFLAECTRAYAAGATVDEQEDSAQARRRVERLGAIAGAIELDVYAQTFEALPTPEQRVLARIAVFRRDCTWEAARAVCGDPSGETLQNLVDACLITIEPGEPPRLLLPETVRDFLLQRLHESGDRNNALRDFAKYFASPRGASMRHNVEAAIAWAMSEDDVAVVAELLARQGMGYVRGLQSEAAIRRVVEFGDRARALDLPAKLRLHAGAIAAHAAFVLGDFATFERLAAWLDEHSRESRDAYVWYVLSKRLLEEGTDLDRAEDYVRTGLAIAGSGDDDQLLCALRVIEANVAWRRGDDLEAARLFGRIVRAMRAGDFHYGFESVMLRSARFELGRNNVDDALARLLDVLRALRRTPKTGATAGVLDAYVEAACRRDKREAALRLHAFTEAFHARHGRYRSPSSQVAYAGMAARYGLPAKPPEPDISTVEEAFELALTI